MIVQTLDNFKYKWKYSSRRQPKSNLQKLASQLVIDEFGAIIRIYHEVTIKITKKPPKSLYLDIYIPCFNLAIETNGNQHDSISSFFHRSKKDFYKQRLNDNQKEEWCRLNHINLITLSDGENLDEWRSKISRATRPNIG